MTLYIGLFSGIVVGLLGAAFFALCEGAFFALSAPPETSFVSGEQPVAPRVIRLLRRPGRLQHAIALGYLLAVVWTSSLAWYLASAFSGGSLGGIAWLVTAGLTAFVVLIVAELIPKSLGMEQPSLWARRAAPLLGLWQAILTPLTASIGGLVRASRRVIGSGPAAEPLSTEEVRSIVDETGEQADLDIGERRMLRSIFAFGGTTVREVMTPRPDIVAVELSTSWDDAVRIIGDAEHSRVPMYDDSIDSIVGIVYAKDLLPIIHGEENPPGNLRGLEREATFVPEAKKIDDLLREFQQRRIHLAVVVDEYGGTAGIVTLEDILEELVGEIQDEYDEEEPLYESLADGLLRLDGRLDFHDFNDLTASELDAEGVDTVGGLVSGRLERVAEGGELVEVDGWTFFVQAVEGNRIAKLLAWREEEDR